MFSTGYRSSSWAQININIDQTCFPQTLICINVPKFKTSVPKLY